MLRDSNNHRQQEGTMRLSILVTTLAIAGTFTGATLHAKDHGGLGEAAQKALKQAVAGPQRTEANRARDQYRHPIETLTFFGVKPKDTVVELWPGGGWYTEILAPYLAEKGQLIAAAPAGKGAEGMAKRFDANPALFGKVQRANFPTVLGGTGVAPGTADVVLTFRNVHNWKMGYMRPDKSDYSEAAFQEIFAMLKPGGVLGIEDHRLPESAKAATSRSRPSAHSQKKRVSGSTASPRSMPTRRTRRTGRKACGPCRRRSPWATRTRQNSPPSVRATA
jgi:predicted methyltransferase